MQSFADMAYCMFLHKCICLCRQWKGTDSVTQCIYSCIHYNLSQMFGSVYNSKQKQFFQCTI